MRPAAPTDDRTDPAERAWLRYRRGRRAFDRLCATGIGLGAALLGAGALAGPEMPLASVGAAVSVGAVLALLAGGVVADRLLRAEAEAWLRRNRPGRPGSAD